MKFNNSIEKLINRSFWTSLAFVGKVKLQTAILLCYITFYLLFENLSHGAYFELFYAPSETPLYNNYNTFCPFLCNIRDFVSDLLEIHTNSSAP